MKVGIICIGDELINGYTKDTNSSFISYQLRIYKNLNVCNIFIVGDDYMQISKNIDYFLKNKIDYIFITGGLGPTHDDLTKKVLCQHFNCKLKVNDDHYKKLLKKFSNKNLKHIKSQAEILDISKPLLNDMGTALPMYFKYKKSSFFILPGVPSEVKSIMNNDIIPNYIKPYFHVNKNHLTILTAGIYESSLYAKLKTIIKKYNNKIKVAFLPGYSGVKIRLTAVGELVSNNDFLKFRQKIESKIKEFVYGYNDDKLNEVLGEVLIENKKTLAVAESCTGGYLSKIITDIPGSSMYYKGGIVAYDNDIKINMLNVKNSIISKYGAVSRQVASVMSENIRKKYKSDYGISTTGISGPGGGSDEKPIGLIYISISSKFETITKKFIFSKDRNINRTIAVFVCLFFLKNMVVIKK